MARVRIGTRGSALALWQAHFVRDALRARHGIEAEIVTLKTSGDRFDQKKIGQIGLKGVFIKELEDALLDGRVDLAVHSLKDVPTETPRGLAFPAITRREEPRDCLVARDGLAFAQLPPGARVGTSSLRRQAQLRHARPDLAVLDLRGNVDTRLKKLARGDYDAVVVAKVGLDRLGRAGSITEIFSPEIMLPAVGQGALAVETRAGDAALAAMLAPLDDAPTRAAVTAERALLAELEGGCQVPVGAWGRIEPAGAGRLLLDACVASPDGADFLRDRAAGDADRPEALGRELARRLIEAGADRILRLVGRKIGD
jgi:hydroxymethylbilane synthase